MVLYIVVEVFYVSSFESIWRYICGSVHNVCDLVLFKEFLAFGDIAA